jgi:hypothetical protein
MLAAHIGAEPLGGKSPAFSSRVVLPASSERLDADALPAGADTLLPRAVLAGPRYSARAEVKAGGELSDAGPEVMLDFTVFLPSPGKRRGLDFMRGQVIFAARSGETVEITPPDVLPAGALQGPPGAPDIFQVDLFTPARSYGNATSILVLSGEQRDESGRRRTDAADDGERKLCLTDDRRANLTRLLLRGKQLPYFERPSSASRYRGAAGRYAEQYSLNPALIMAVMHTESNFNPSVVSGGRAVGLMQLVPDTAGYEVHRYLTGSPDMPGQDILLSPEHNIRYGAAYLHLLGRRYFGGVRNSLSRQLCVIAAYNGGPNAVLRLFDPADGHNAVQRINALAPEQLYDHLTTRMPTPEARRYVELVLSRLRSYSINGEY